MKVKLLMTIAAAVSTWLGLTGLAAAGSVSIDNISGTWSDGTSSYLDIGQHTIRFRLRASEPVSGLSDAFDLLSPDLAVIYGIQGRTLPAWNSIGWDYETLGYQIMMAGSSNWQGVAPPFDLAPDDTGMVGFMGTALPPDFLPGLPAGFNDVTWEIDFTVLPGDAGKHFCLAKHTAGPWDWVWICAPPPDNHCEPDFYPPACLEIRPRPNFPPQFTNCVATLPVHYGETFQYDFDATDPEGEPITFQILSGPGSINASTGLYILTPGPEHKNQNISLVVCAADPNSQCQWNTCRVTLRVDNGGINTLPTITNCPSQITVGQDGAPHMFDFDAMDPDGDRVTFSVISGPGEIQPSTGVWYYTPTFSDVGKTYPLRICAMDPVHICSMWSAKWCTVNVTVLGGCSNSAPQPVCTSFGTVEYPNILRVHLDTPVDADPGDTYHWFLYANDSLEGEFSFDGDWMTFVPTRHDAQRYGPRIRLGAVDSHGAFGLCQEEWIGILAPNTLVEITETKVSPTNRQPVSGHIYVDLLQKWNMGDNTLRGFDFLMGYDTASMTLSNVFTGEPFDTPGEYEWEQLDYSVVGDCEGVCPRGLLRIHGTPDIANGPHQPHSCVLGDNTLLATLDFQYKGTPPAPGQYVPLQFFWKDCSDNRFGPPSLGPFSDTMFVSNHVYDYGINLPKTTINESSDHLPTYLGIPDDCYLPYEPGLPAPFHFIDFYSVFPFEWRLWPAARIDAITPDQADYGQVVSFAGSGTPGQSGGVVMAYEWQSSLDGLLSTEASFSSTALSPGEHYITLRVRDDHNRWSEGFRRRLTIIPPPNTFVGTDVLVDVGHGAVITFASVTQNGRTEAQVMSAGPPSGGVLGIVPLGAPEYFDITTSALYSGLISVCLSYSESDLAGNESELRLLHYEGNAWVDITSSLDVDRNVICGTVSSFSYFALAEPCCVGRVGDANGIGTYPQEVTISDIQTLVTAKFISSLPCEQNLHCLTEADVNQSGGANPTCNDITISDIQTLVNHLFIAGPANAPLKDCL